MAAADDETACNVPVGQIPEHEWNRIARSMCPIPDGLSTYGMIHPKDKNNVRGLIARDEATLAKCGVTHEQLAGAMVELVKAVNATKPTKSSMLLTVYPDGRFFDEDAFVFDFFGECFRGTFVAWKGLQKCPFKNNSGPSCFGAVDYVFEKQDGTRLQFNDLLIHMIAVHHFFEGSELKKTGNCVKEEEGAYVSAMKNPWRVDPEHACAFLKDALKAIQAGIMRPDLSTFV